MRQSYFKEKKQTREEVMDVNGRPGFERTRYINKVCDPLRVKGTWDKIRRICEKPQSRAF